SIAADVIAAFLDHGADVNQRDQGNTALLMATTQDRIDVVRRLLARHADTHLRGFSDQTQLEWASARDTPEARQIVRLLTCTFHASRAPVGAQRAQQAAPLPALSAPQRNDRRQ